VSGENPRKVTVKMKRGSWEVEITAPEDRIQQAVESTVAGMASRELPVLEIESRESRERQGGTCKGLLLVMWKEGFFSQPRALSEAHDDLIRRGYHFDRTAVAHTLVDLVREGTLFREGTQRNFRYVQKRPLQPASGAGNQTGAADLQDT
jgi:hypothetical protein